MTGAIVGGAVVGGLFANKAAGKDIYLKPGGRCLIEAQEATCDALMGNLAPPGSTFGDIVFEGTYVNSLEEGFSGGISITF